MPLTLYQMAKILDLSKWMTKNVTNPLPHVEILDESKFEEFADNN